MPFANSAGSSRPIRVLHVVGSLNRGGIETWLRGVVGCLPRDRYKSDFCTYRFGRGAYAAELEQLGCEIHNIPLGSTPVSVFRFAKRFRRLLREGRYDVVHCHGLLLVGFILFLSRAENTPVRIGHAHNIYRKGADVTSLVNRPAGALNRSLTRVFSTHGIGCSTESAETLFGKRWWRNPKYQVIHCGIDLTPFEVSLNADLVRSQFGIEPGANVMGHVGSFTVAKNHRFLIEVAANVIRQRENTVLLLVGDGILRPSIEKACAEFGISQRVIFAGVSSRVPELMRCAIDVFVMPSLHEGLPLVLLEAQAAGLPCLVSDVVPREVMVSEDTIRFLPLDSGSECWGSAVLSLLDKPNRRPDLLARMATSDYNVVASARHLEDLYGAAVAGIVRNAPMLPDGRREPATGDVSGKI
jgi:glycosyltransferase involved in cell wall biosynthesis